MSNSGAVCQHESVPSDRLPDRRGTRANSPVDGRSSEPCLDRRSFLRRAAAAAGAVALPAVLDLAACSSSSDPPHCGLGAAGDIARLEAAVGRRLTYQRIYHQEDLFPGEQERVAWAAGRIPVSSFKTLQPDGSPIPFGDVAAGAADDHLRALANAIRPTASRPMLLLYFAEPENDVGEAPADFAPAFRRVRTIMGTLGPGVRWGHTLSHGTYDAGDGELYYPGDEFVDVITCDGYNWCPDAGHGALQESFDALFTATNRFAERKGKLWYATEVGTWNDPTPGWSKAPWIQGMGRAAKRFPNLRGIMWFDHDVEEGFLCDWKISEPDAVRSFAALARDPYFG